MRPSDKIKEFIKSFESCSLVAYKPLPTDRWTIGWGSTFLRGQSVEQGDSISQNYADEMFEDMLNNFAIELSTITPDSVTQNQFDAALSLCYNIGFSAFKSSNTGVMYEAGKDISQKFPLWDMSGGQVIKGLENRRLKEQKIYENNVYEYNGE